MAKFNLNDYLERVFDFAFGMTFENLGEHREHRTGGQVKRENGELFINTFQGKLSEFGMHKFFFDKGIKTEEPDLGMWKKGIWDDADLEIYKKKINIKSAAFFSNLLLLESKDWDNAGNYIPNLEKKNAAYDFFILTRIQPDGKGLMRKEKLFYSKEIEKEKLKKLIFQETWKFDIAGFITYEELKCIIGKKHILPQNALLNGKTLMDAENYYCQAGDMRDIGAILPLL